MNLLIEIGHFLIPGFDALQMGFFAVMLLAVLYTWLSVRRNAQETHWQHARGRRNMPGSEAVCRQRSRA